MILEAELHREFAVGPAAQGIPACAPWDRPYLEARPSGMDAPGGRCMTRDALGRRPPGSLGDGTDGVRFRPPEIH
jgi:hypothetical protein